MIREASQADRAGCQEKVRVLCLQELSTDLFLRGAEYSLNELTERVPTGPPPN